MGLNMGRDKLKGPDNEFFFFWPDPIQFRAGCVALRTWIFNSVLHEPSLLISFKENRNEKQRALKVYPRQSVVERVISVPERQSKTERDGKSEAKMDIGGRRSTQSRRQKTRHRQMEGHPERPWVQSLPLFSLQYWSQGLSLSLSTYNYMPAYLYNSWESRIWVYCLLRKKPKKVVLGCKSISV